MSLARGASLDAAIRLDGAPAAGATCRLVDPGADDDASAAAAVEWARTEADADGRCRASRLPPGRLRLEIEPPGALVQSLVRHRVDLVEGETLVRDFDLESVRVTGHVRRGEAPLAGWKLLFVDRSETASGNLEPPVTEVETDEQGEFEARLWHSGAYSVSLRDARGTPAGSRLPDLVGPEDRLDFDLAGQEIRGTAVDDGGRAVAGARVVLAWLGRSWRLGTSAKDGTFAFSVDTESGEGTLQAHHPEYRSSKEVPFRFEAGAALPPLVLTLADRDRLTGRLTLASGAPAPGVAVQAFAVTPGQPPRLVGAAEADAEGRFRVPIEAAHELRLFVHGPACPLTAFAPPAKSEAELELGCDATPAALKLEVRDSQGRPVAGLGILLRFAGSVLPSGVLEPYLARFGLAPITDGAGHLVLPGLPPGEYDLFVASGASEATIAAGSPSGRIGSLSLTHGAVAELAVEVASPD